MTLSHLSTPCPSWMLRSSLGLALAGLLAGCASPDVQDYAQQQPAMDLREYFNGPLTAHGLFTDRSGRVVKRFTVQMTGHWDGDNGTLDEHFVYSDGTTQRRIWRLRYLGGGRYAGTADDVVGEALSQTAGNAFHWKYTLALPFNGSVWNVALDDWMYRMDARTVLNRSTMSKFGLHLGELTLALSKASQE